MIRSLIILLFVVISFSRFSDGQPLSDHRSTVEEAQMEQRILANIRPLLMKLCTSDTPSGHENCEHQSAITDSIQALTARVSALERQIEKQKKDVCKALFKKVEAHSTVHVFKDRCYLFGSANETWDNAQEKCQLVGANLVSVMSKGLQDFIDGIKMSEYRWRQCFSTGVNSSPVRATAVHEYIRVLHTTLDLLAQRHPLILALQVNLRSCRRAVTHDWYICTGWIGAKRTTTDGNFTWIENGRLLSDTYTNWGNEQPNNNGVDCVITFYTSMWHDFDCSSTSSFICEL